MKEELIPLNNILLIALFFLINICKNFLWLLPSALMSPIMCELNLDYTQSGQLVLIVTVMMGIFLILGNYFLTKIGLVRAMCIGLLCIAMDGFFTCFGKNFIIVFIGKFFCGIGYGLTTCSSTTLIVSCFSGKQIGVINGINTCIANLSISLAYQYIVPIYEITGSWRKEAILIGICSIVCAILFALWGIKSKNKINIAKSIGRKSNNVYEAWQHPTIRKFILVVSSIILVNVCINSYYPNYLHETVGFSLDEASNLTGIISFAGIFSSLGTGFIIHKINHQKRFLVIMLNILAGSFALMMYLRSYCVLMVAICIFGVVYYIVSTFCATIVMRLEEIDPLVASAGVSCMNAYGSLLALLVPAINQFLVKKWGVQNALALFLVLFIPAILGGVSLPQIFYKVQEDAEIT